MSEPCTLHGGRPRLPKVAWDFLPGDSILLHQAPSRMWPADLEFRSHEARDRWEAVQRNLETQSEFPEMVQRLMYKSLADAGALSAISTEILRRLKAELETVKDQLPEGMAESEDRAWRRAGVAIDEALRQVKRGK